MQDDELRVIKIPPNYNSKKKIGNLIKWRNLVEASIWLFIIASTIWNTPMLMKAKLVLITGIGGPIAILNLIGIKNVSVTQFIFSYIKFVRANNKYQLRSVKDAKTNSKNTNIQITTNIQRAAEEDTNNITLLINKLKEIKNSKTGTSETAGRKEQRNTVIPTKTTNLIETIREKIRKK